MEAVAIQPLEFMDESLDAAQRQAVARALATPDVFLLQGLPGTGRARVLAEILHQAALRGDRVLFLASQFAPLDVVLSRLRHYPTICALRFQAPGEASESLPMDITSLMPSHRQRTFVEETNRKANALQLEAERQCADRRAETEAWPALAELAGRIERLQRHIHERTERLERTAAEVGRAAATGTLAEPCREKLACLETSLAQRLATLSDDCLSIDAQARAATAERMQLAETMAALAPLAQAKRARRWWTWAWWRATLTGKVLANMADLENRRQALETTLQALDHCRQEIDDKCRRAETDFAAEKLKLMEQEIDRCRQELLGQIAADREELAPLEEAWRGLVAELNNPEHRPTEATPAAVAVAEDAWQRRLSADAETCRFAHRWADYWTGDGARLGFRVTDWANVLAGTTAALSHDAAFAEAAQSPFDLLVLEDADQFTDTEILKLARHAARQVFVAPTLILPAEPAIASLSDSDPELGGFQKLWRQFGGSTHRLAYAWTSEGDRLCATLRPLSQRDRQYLESERLADFPDIELRILALPKAAPVVAQVAFPRAMTIQDAKQFIYRELEEAAIEGWTSGAWLDDNSDRFILNWETAPPGDLEYVELEPGLREWLTPPTARTSRLEFTCAAGWTRQRVDDWLMRYLGMRDSGRTMTLRTPHRLNGDGRPA